MTPDPRGMRIVVPTNMRFRGMPEKRWWRYYQNVEVVEMSEITCSHSVITMAIICLTLSHLCSNSSY